MVCCGCSLVILFSWGVVISSFCMRIVFGSVVVKMVSAWSMWYDSISLCGFPVIPPM